MTKNKPKSDAQNNAEHEVLARHIDELSERIAKLEAGCTRCRPAPGSHGADLSEYRRHYKL